MVFWPKAWFYLNLFRQDVLILIITHTHFLVNLWLRVGVMHSRIDLKFGSIQGSFFSKGFHWDWDLATERNELQNRTDRQRRCVCAVSEELKNFRTRYRCCCLCCCCLLSAPALSADVGRTVGSLVLLPMLLLLLDVAVKLLILLHLQLMLLLYHWNSCS